MAQCWCNSLQSFQAPVEIIQEKKKKVKASPRISNIYLRAVDCHAVPTVFQITLRLNDTRCVVQMSTLMWFLMQAVPQGLFCPWDRAALGLPKQPLLLLSVESVMLSWGPQRMKLEPSSRWAVQGLQASGIQRLRARTDGPHLFPECTQTEAVWLAGSCCSRLD